MDKKRDRAVDYGNQPRNDQIFTAHGNGSVKLNVLSSVIFPTKEECFDFITQRRDLADIGLFGMQGCHFGNGRLQQKTNIQKIQCQLFLVINKGKSKRIVKELTLQINNLPMMNPEIVTAIGLMLLFTSLNIKTGFMTLLLAHIAFCIPYVMLSIMPKLRQMDPNLPEAALDLGATPWQALIKVIVPEIMPGIVSGALIAFTMSFDDFVISFFTTGPGINNISIYVYSMYKRINPSINALSTIIVVMITVVLILVNVIPLVKERKLKKNEKLG